MMKIVLKIIIFEILLSLMIFTETPLFNRKKKENILSYLCLFFRQDELSDFV